MKILIFNREYDLQWGGITWENVYDFFGVRDFIYFISAPGIQETLFPIKLVFIFFTMFFFCAVIWFYVNSSYIQYKFLQDVTEFFSKETYGLRKINKNWRRIKKRIEAGGEAELKLAIIEADDFLYQNLQDAGYQGVTFEELVADAAKKSLPNAKEILEAHVARNAIVYDPSFKITFERASRVLSVYESTIKSLAIS